MEELPAPRRGRLLSALSSGNRKDWGWGGTEGLALGHIGTVETRHFPVLFLDVTSPCFFNNFPFEVTLVLKAPAEVNKLWGQVCRKQKAIVQRFGTGLISQFGLDTRSQLHTSPCPPYRGCHSPGSRCMRATKSRLLGVGNFPR